VGEDAVALLGAGQWHRVVAGSLPRADLECLDLATRSRVNSSYTAADVTTFYHDRAGNRFLGNIRFAASGNVENENRLRFAWIHLQSFGSTSRSNLRRIERLR